MTALGVSGNACQDTHRSAATAPRRLRLRSRQPRHARHERGPGHLRARPRHRCHRRVNLKEDGRQSAGSAFWPDISADGRYVAYRTHVGDLDAACPPGQTQVYVTDRKADTNECVSVDPAGQPGNDYSDQPHLSADGRYVTFFSDATNLDPASASAAGARPTSAIARPTRRHARASSRWRARRRRRALPRHQCGRPDHLVPDRRDQPRAGLSGDGSSQMFVRDLDRGVNTCASVGENGQGNAPCSGPERSRGTGTSSPSGRPDRSSRRTPTASLQTCSTRRTYGVTTIASTATVEPTRT